jgi:MFS transporter, MHS family, proline/betaine transporter
VQAAFAVMAGCLVSVIFVVLPDLFKDNWQGPALYVMAMGLLAAPIACSISLKKRGQISFFGRSTEPEQRRASSSIF